MQVTFPDAAGSEVKFDEHGDGLPRYEILNFRKSDHNGTNGYHYRASESTFDFFPPLLIRELPKYDPSATLPALPPSVPWLDELFLRERFRHF